MADYKARRDRSSLRGLTLDELRRSSTTTDSPRDIVRQISIEPESPVADFQTLAANTQFNFGQNDKRLNTGTPFEPRHPVTFSETFSGSVLNNGIGAVKPCTPVSSTLPLEFGTEQEYSFDFSPVKMVREQEPARNPLSPAKMNPQPTRRPEDDHGKSKHTAIVPPSRMTSQNVPPTEPPKFGRPSALGPSTSPYAKIHTSSKSSTDSADHKHPSARTSDQYSNLFVSRPGQHRPDLHKPQTSTNPLRLNRDQTQTSSQNRDPPPVLIPEPRLDVQKPVVPRPFAMGGTSNPSLRPFDPFSSIPNPGPQPFFSSTIKTNPYYQPKSNYVDLTVDSIGTATNRGLLQDGHAATDPYTYMDAGKANENIKALLEGALEDEDDKPRTRRKKKQTEAKIDDLAQQMQTLDVKKDEAEPEGEEEEEDDGTVHGLKVKLLPHQIDGVAWMMDKELGTKKTRGVLPKGGILADDMGLGKTIQSIALILQNQRPSVTEVDASKRKLSDKVGRGTLVVAPLALIKQWEAEISDKVEDTHSLKVRVHHGPQRTKSYKELAKFDVVITTYQTLSSEHASSEKDLKVGAFGLHWYRVILDEAHSIKNRNAKASRAACALEAEFRWCLSGTPMQNNLDELQSLIHFLRIKPYEDLEAWREQITRPMNNGRGGLAIRRLQVYLKAFMKRRTKEVLKQEGALKIGKDDKQTGQKANSFKIVNRSVEKLEVDFSHEEREFYKRLESRTDKSLEQMMAGNKVSYASALVLLLRLRQACNHPRLIKSDLGDEKEAFSGTQTPRRKVSKDDDMDEMAAMLGGLSVETKRCDVCQIELSKQEIKDSVIRCAECEDDLADQVVKKKEKKKKSKSAGKKPIVLDSEDEDDNSEDDVRPAGRRVKKNVVNLISDDGEKDSASDDEEDSEDGSEDASIDLVSSTKIRHLINILKTDSKTHKYIVFSFFTSMLNLIEPFLKTQRIRFVRYDGQMRNDAREASLHSLRHDPTTRVLLCSLRAGSLGLNLTAASRVVILEPFWNPFVEEQAIDRVHRLNQTEDVVVYKMTIKDTVEARILELQEKKRELANATIEGKKGGLKLTLQDMLKLFRHDAESESKLDMIGMKDRRGLLEKGESTAESQVYRGPQESSSISDGVDRQEKDRKRDHEVFGRRW